MSESQGLYFFESPTVELGGNKFTGFPVLLQVGKTPLMELVQEQEAGFTTQFQIFNKDGVYIAKVKGSRVFATPDGQKAGLVTREPDRMTVCELDGRTVFELRRREAAALSTEAELFTPDGRFVRVTSETAGLFSAGDALQIGRMTISGVHFKDDGRGVAILFGDDGSVSVGVHGVSPGA